LTGCGLMYENKETREIKKERKEGREKKQYRNRDR
jgi:hypothetical protein